MSETTNLIGHSEDLKRLKAYQPFAFFVTFGGYFMAHFSRKCYSTVKQQLQTDAGYSAMTSKSAYDVINLSILFSFLLVEFSLLLGGSVLVLLVLRDKVVHVALSFSVLHLVHAPM